MCKNYHPKNEGRIFKNLYNLQRGCFHKIVNSSPMALFLFLLYLHCHWKNFDLSNSKFGAMHAPERTFCFCTYYKQVVLKLIMLFAHHFILITKMLVSLAAKLYNFQFERWALEGNFSKLIA